MRPANISVRLLAFVLGLVVGHTPARASEEVQTDWSGGGGVTGPLPEWQDSFDSSASVSWLAVPGQLALSASGVGSPPGQLVDESYQGSFGIDGADLDGDGDTDLVGAADVSGIVSVWWNDGGDPPAWTEQTITSAFPGASSVVCTDLNRDGRQDVLANAAGGTNDIIWWRNDGGDPVVWSAQTVDSDWTSCFELSVGDVDQDGNLDVLAASWTDGLVAWWCNDGGDPILWTRQIVDSTFAGAHSVKTADIDGDGDHDLAAAGGLDHEIVWYRNDGGDPIAWTKVLVRDGFQGARSVSAADIDADGDTDLVATCWTNHVAWWRNDGGDPITWTEQTLNSQFVGGHSLEVADLNGDGRLDVTAVAYSSHDVLWWENGGGDPISWTEWIVRDSYRNPIVVGVADVDGDGALDVLATSYYFGRFKWFAPTQFLPSGELTSTILDLGSGSSAAELDWVAAAPPGTALSFRVRSSDDPADLGAWSAQIANPGSLAGGVQRYVQYKAEFATTDPEMSPLLEEVTLTLAATAVGRASPAAAQPLLRVWPNPTRPSATVSLALAAAGPVRLALYDVAGRRVRCLARGVFAAGTHELAWDGCDDGGARLAAGTYFVRVETAQGVGSRKVTLLR